MNQPVRFQRRGEPRMALGELPAARRYRQFRIRGESGGLWRRSRIKSSRQTSTLRWEQVPMW
ncbi:hypothetical protein MHI43_05760 [Paenibacillus sp. FSL H8-0457]|uniref:hypothetical protein n=1 Tax=Paenibacillus sp. FSL H8-0457 TaxID=2921386 RepID=UPI0031016D46